MTSADQDPIKASKPATKPLTPTWLRDWHFPEDRVYVVDGRPAEHWILEFVGRFSTLQNNIESLLGAHLRKSSPFLGKKIEQRHLKRLTDEDRWDYVKALTRDSGYQGNLVHSASDAFARCKRVRDFASHHTGMILMYDSAGNAFYDVSDEKRQPPMPDPLTPESFRKLVTECRWLEAFVNHIAYLSGLRFISLAARRNEAGEPEPQYLEIMEPPALPVPADWDPNKLIRNVESPNA